MSPYETIFATPISQFFIYIAVGGVIIVGVLYLLMHPKIWEIILTLIFMFIFGIIAYAIGEAVVTKLIPHLYSVVTR